MNGREKAQKAQKPNFFCAFCAFFVAKQSLAFVFQLMDSSVTHLTL